MQRENNFLNCYFPRDAFLKAFSSDLFFSVPFQLLRLHLMAVLSCPAIQSELSLCFLVGNCSSGAGCGTVMTHAALENLLKQEDSTFRTPLRKILCIRLMFSCFYPTNPKKQWSVCMSLQWHPKSDVSFWAHDHSAIKV